MRGVALLGPPAGEEAKGIVTAKGRKSGRKIFYVGSTWVYNFEIITAIKANDSVSRSELSQKALDTHGENH